MGAAAYGGRGFKERTRAGLCLAFSSSRRVSPPPPPETKVTIVGKNEICKMENLMGPFLVHKILGPRTPPLPPNF